MSEIILQCTGMLEIKGQTVEPDINAKSYQRGNGRFDLMTDEEVRSFNAGEFDMVFGRLGDLMQRGESSPMQELYHKLYELRLRYPERDFCFEVLPAEDELV